MSKIYVIPADQRQAAYDELKKLASQYSEADIANPVEPLTTIDFFTYKNSSTNTEHKPFQLPVRLADGSETVLANTEILSSAYKNLCLMDENHDGQIDLTTPKADLIFSETSDASFDANAKKDLYSLYQDSVFQVEPTYANQDSPGVTCYVFIVDSKDNSDGTKTYYLVGPRSGIDRGVVQETSYQLTSLSGNFSFGSAKLVGTDITTELAVLELTTTSQIRFAHLLPDDEKPALREDVLVLAKTPLSAAFLDRDFIGGSINIQLAGQTVPKSRIQTDLPIMDNFGFPALDTKGHVIGLVETTMTDPKTYAVVLPSNIIKSSLTNVLTNRSTQGTVYSDWGMEIDIMNQGEQRRDILPVGSENLGVILTKITPGGPAERAGLKTGDILLKLDGNEDPFSVHSDKELPKFFSAQLNSPTSIAVNITYFRPSTGEILTTQLTPIARTYTTPACYATKYGFTVWDISASQRNKYNLTSNTQGVMVYEIARKTDKGHEGEAKDELIPGLHEDMLITAVNNTPTPDVPSFTKAWEEALKSDKPIRLDTYNTSAGNQAVGAKSFAVIVP